VFDESGISEANEILGSQLGSQRRQTMGDVVPLSAGIGAAKELIRPHRQCPATSQKCLVGKWQMGHRAASPLPTVLLLGTSRYHDRQGKQEPLARP
jgi:hypothetical protein